MKRLRLLFINILLTVVSAALVFGAALGADRILDHLLPKPPYPGATGLLFPPQTEQYWKTHDYTCVDRINALGFRDRDVSLEKGTAYRVLAIGDSFTYGWGVNLEETWVKIVEQNLCRQGMDVELLDLGKPAANPRQYVVIAEKAIPLLNPDLIVLGVLAGDDLQQIDFKYALKDDYVHLFPGFSRVREHWKYFRGAPWPEVFPSTQSEEEDRNNLVRTAKEIFDGMGTDQRARFDALETPVKDVFFNGMLNPWMIGHATSAPGYFLCLDSPDSMEYRFKRCVLTHELKRLKKVAGAYRVPVVTLSIPEGFLVNDTAYKNIQRVGFHMTPGLLMSENADKAVQQACASAGIPFHEVSQGFRDRRGDPALYFELDRHLTAAGNKLYGDLVTPIVAQAIADAPRKTQ